MPEYSLPSLRRYLGSAITFRFYHPEYFSIVCKLSTVSSYSSLVKQLFKKCWSGWSTINAKLKLLIVSVTIVHITKNQIYIHTHIYNIKYKNCLSCLNVFSHFLFIEYYIWEYYNCFCSWRMSMFDMLTTGKILLNKKNKSWSFEINSTGLLILSLKFDFLHTIFINEISHTYQHEMISNIKIYAS